METAGTHNVTPVVIYDASGNPVASSGLLLSQGFGFSKTATPTVTNGAYSANDIMGGLLEFTVGSAPSGLVFLHDIQVIIKSNVSPSFLAIVFGDAPTATTTDDNAAYSINTADAFKIAASIPFNDMGGYSTVHAATIKSFRVGDLGIGPIALVGTKLYMLLIDQTGVTLTATDAVQVRVSGMGV